MSIDAQWINNIEKLWEYYHQAKYTQGVEYGKQLLASVPATLKSLLYVALVDFAVRIDDMAKADEYAQLARQNFTSETSFIDETTLVVKENSLLLCQGQPDKCRENLNNSGFADSYLAKIQLAECDYWNGKFSNAVQGYQQALQNCVDNENLQSEAKLCWLGEARSQLRLQNLVDANTLLQKIYKRKRCIVSDNTEEEIIVGAGELARVKALQGAVPEARLMFHTDLVPEKLSHPYKTRFAFLNRGIVRYIAGSLEGASADLQQVVTLQIRKFDKLEAFLFLGHIATLQGELEQAEKFYREVSAFPQLFFAQQLSEERQHLEQQLHLRPQIIAKAETDDHKQVEPEPQPVKVQTKPAVTTEEVEKDTPPAQKVVAPLSTEAIAGDGDSMWYNLPWPAILLGMETLDMQKK